MEEKMKSNEHSALSRGFDHCFGHKDGTGTVITRVTVRKWRGSYPRNRKAEPRGILYV